MGGKYQYKGRSKNYRKFHSLGITMNNTKVTAPKQCTEASGHNNRSTKTLQGYFKF